MKLISVSFLRGVAASPLTRGARIETTNKCRVLDAESRPSPEGRELKPYSAVIYRHNACRPSPEGRELKQHIVVHIDDGPVAPHPRGAN